MSADALLSTWLRPARRRTIGNDMLIALPVLLTAAAVAARLWGLPAAVMLLLAGGALLFLWTRARVKRFDRQWLVRRLDAVRPDMEDSAALLFADPHSLSGLQRLQRSRLDQRLDDGSPEALAPDWSRRTIILVWITAAVILIAAWLWPGVPDRPVILSPAAEGLATAPGIPQLTGQNLRIIPPTYTGLPLRDEARLDARAPQGSRLEWTLRFAPQASAPALAMLGGTRMALRRDGDNWIASRPLDASFLYRVDAASGRGPLPPLHRIDAIVDAPPQVKVIAPSASLTMVGAGQRSWSPLFAA
ncbi:MAG: DUF4175 domain-containing protein, partial [bacterium]|nr:DUF4175 domain-containing protein [bacterium]